MKKLFWIILLLIPVLGIRAQKSPTVADLDTTRSALRTTWKSNRPGDNWFITLSAGIADLNSEESRYRSFGDRIAPTFGLSVGKWMNPVWGLRMNITGAKIEGFATWNYTTNLGIGDWYTGVNYANPMGVAREPYTPAFTTAGGSYIQKNFLKEKADSKEGPGYTYEFQYAGASLDFLLNLKNFFQRYNPKALFNPILYGGLGYAHTFKEGDRTAVNSIFEKFGLMLDFRLSDAWSVNADAQFMLLPEVFDRRVGDNNTQDLLNNYFIGVTYKFGERNFTQVVPRSQSEIDGLNNQINTLRGQLAAVVPVPCPECPKLPDCAGSELTGYVKDRDGNALSGASVFVMNNDTKTVTVLRTDASGKYLVKVPCGASLGIKAVKSGYAEDCMPYSASSERTGVVEKKQVPQLKLEKFKVGQIFKIENIYYDFDKSDIRPDAALELDKTVQFLKDNPEIKVELGSHTDSRGNATYNQTLSQKRADAAVAYIIGKGIDNSRIKGKGYGESKLVNECKDGVNCTDEQHQANRRTELRVTGVEAPKASTSSSWSKYTNGQVIQASELPTGFFSNCK